MSFKISKERHGSTYESVEPAGYLQHGAVNDLVQNLQDDEQGMSEQILAHRGAAAGGPRGHKVRRVGQVTTEPAVESV